MNDEPQRALIYTRISRDDSGEGRSNDRQEAACRMLCEMRGWEVVKVEADISHSAYTGRKRPGWENVKSSMHAGEADIVVAWKLDRITRTVRELTDIIQLSRDTGVPIVTAEGDFDLRHEMGKAFATIAGVISELEVETKGRRQRLANEQRRAEGKRWPSGWRAFGYELDGTIIPREADLIQNAARDVLAGTPLRQIARRWTALGVSTPRSSKGASGWTHHGVKAILRNPRNAGWNTYKGEIVGRGNWSPILDDETHALLNALLSDPARRTNGNGGRHPANLLSGLARCAVCEELVTGGTVGRRGGSRVSVYKCRNDHLSTYRTEVDEFVRGQFAIGMDYVSAHELTPLVGAPTSEQDPFAEVDRIRTNLAALAESFAADRISLEQMETGSLSLRERLRRAESAMADTPADSLTDDELVNASRERFLAMDTTKQRDLLARWARVWLFPKGRGRKSVPLHHQVRVDMVYPLSDGTDLHTVLTQPPPDVPDED